MLQHEKQKVLEALASEDELRRDLVIPLLKKMEMFSDVLDNQGTDEVGVDVIGVSTSPFKKPEYTAFVLKHGNITLKSADKKNNLINIVETQIRAATRHPLTHPRLPSEKAYASRVVVLTNGTISNNAENALRRAFPDINLDFVGQDRLIDQLDLLWPRFYEDRRPFLSSYAKKLFDSLNVVDLEELGYAKRKRSLSELYIDALLYEQDPITTENIDFDKAPIPGERLCSQTHKLMVVTSGPGGGKTTLLKEIAILQSKEAADQVAVYLHARDVLESKDLLRKSAEILSQLSQDTADDVYQEIRSAKLLLLVDGLDELAQVSDREAVVGRLNEASLSLGARVIVGTRPESNPSVVAALAGFKLYSISPLRKSQIRSFFGKWFSGNADKASKLLTALEDKGIFEKLPKTPMTMTLVAIVYESKEDIPSTITELYGMFVELLTGKWDANRRLSSGFDSQMKVSFLSRLAWIMQSERLETISQDRCLALADSFFEDEATLRNVNVQDFIQSIIDRSHILIPTGRDQLRFSHMTFQEYFCAEYLFHEYPSTETILSWFGDDWWTEVLFFLAGKRKNIAQLVGPLLAADYDHSETRLTRLTTLGSLLQAGFLTPKKYKNEVVQFAAERFLLALDDLQRALRGTKSPKLQPRIGRLMLLGVLEQLFVANFSSIYLKQALEETYRGLPAGREYEGSRFFIASALARMGVFDAVLEFATNPAMVDPSMYLLSGARLDKQNLTDAEQEQYRRLRKRLDTFRRAIKRELGSLLKTRKRSLKSRRTRTGKPKAH